MSCHAKRGWPRHGAYEREKPRSRKTGLSLVEVSVRLSLSSRRVSTSGPCVLQFPTRVYMLRSCLCELSSRPMRDVLLHLHLLVLAAPNRSYRTLRSHLPLDASGACERFPVHGLCDHAEPCASLGVGTGGIIYQCVALQCQAVPDVRHDTRLQKLGSAPTIRRSWMQDQVVQGPLPCRNAHRVWETLRKERNSWETCWAAMHCAVG